MLNNLFSLFAITYIWEIPGPDRKDIALISRFRFGNAVESSNNLKSSRARAGLLILSKMIISLSPVRHSFSDGGCFYDFVFS